MIVDAGAVTDEDAGISGTGAGAGAGMGGFSFKGSFCSACTLFSGE